MEVYPASPRVRQWDLGSRRADLQALRALFPAFFEEPLVPLFVEHPLDREDAHALGQGATRLPGRFRTREDVPTDRRACPLGGGVQACVSAALVDP